MADDDVTQQADSTPPQIQTPVDPQVLASLMAGIGPNNPPQPPDTLQGKAAGIAASQAAPPVQPPSMASIGAPSPQLPPALAEAISNVPKGAASYPMIQGGLTPEQAQQPPHPTIGGLPGLIMDLLKPGRNVAPGQMVPSKLDRFESFLGNFLQSLSAGFANEGHGPGAAMRGAAAAMQAPYQQGVQQWQMGLQQKQLESQEQLRAAQEEFNRQRAKEYSTVTVPQVGPDGKIVTDANGSPQMIQMPAKEAGPYLSRIGAAGITGAAGVQKAQIAAKAKMDVAQLQLKTAQGAASRFIPDVDGQGNRFYHVYNKYGKEIGQADVNVIPSLMSKTSSTIEYKQQEDGSWVALPKMTTTGPMIPNRAGPQGSVGVSSAVMPKAKSGGNFWATSGNQGTGLKAIPVLGANGQPLFGKAPENIRTMAYTAKSTIPHMDDILDEIDQLDKLGVLGQFVGKGTNYLTSKGFTVPADLTPEQTRLLGKFADDVKLMDSAMLRTHFGARGGQQMYEKFSEMLNAGEHVELMRGALDSFRSYLTGYGDMLTLQTRGGKSGGGTTPPPNKAGQQTNDDGFPIIK